MIRGKKAQPEGGQPTTRYAASAIVCLALALIGGAHLSAEAVQSPQPAPPSPRAVLDKYCVTCHNDKLKTAGLVLSGLDVERAGEHPEIWERVVRKLRTREMPPPKLPRPDQATYTEIANQLESRLDAAAAARPNPGRVAVHRLNRVEYANAVRDLLGFEIDGKTLLPADDVNQEGFDNLASVLDVSPSLLENYLSAARSISRLAINDPAISPVVDIIKISKALTQDERMSDELPFGSQGGIVIKHHFPLDGEYAIEVKLRRQEYDYLVGMGEPHQIEIRLDGMRLRRFQVGGEAKGATMPESYAGNTQGGPEFEVYMHNADSGLKVRVPVKAGDHTVGISFLRRFWEPEGVLQPPQTGFARTTNEYYHGNPGVEIVSIGGPYTKNPTSDSPSQRRLFVCQPKDTASEEPCARKILTTLATRAYRRTLSAADVETLVSFYQAGRTGGNFDAGIERGVERILAAPSFIFRIESPPSDVAQGSAYYLNDVDLASRISFFLWSSIPDDELRDIAIAGKLKDPAILQEQVRRMLRDSRSKALVDNFADRWLGLNQLAGLVPDTLLYPEFDENLRQAMAEETRLFIESQLREDRDVADLVSARDTFLNERLARHYGIPDIYGNRFRRVTFSDGRRGGLLGQASVMAVTSYPNRTSVVLRGKWVLTNLIGAPPPPPPPDVPALKEAGADGQPRSLRQRMEMHRNNAVCASCHQRMDPIGFSLENYDVLGKWRTEADGAPIDAEGTMPDGTRFDGVSGLRDFLLSHREDFARTFTAKLLTYAIGRGVEYTDMPAVRTIGRNAAQNDYRWSSIVFEIVKSTPFRMGIDGSGQTLTAERK